jgi:MoxR-like ATPase
MVGASNELPESEELDALYDRFLFRREVTQVSADSVPALLQLAARQGTFDLGEEESGSVDFFEAQPLSVEELRAVKDQALAEVRVKYYSHQYQFLQNLATFEFIWIK